MKFCLAYNVKDSNWTNEKVLELKQEFVKVEPKFKGNRMHDASEFLTAFLDGIDANLTSLLETFPDKMITLKDDYGQEKTLTNYVKSNFMYKKITKFECLSCGHETQTGVSEELTLFLVFSEVPDEQSITELLETAFEDEVVDKRCQECSSETALSSTKIVELPRCLKVVLKRYEFSEERCVKVNKDIKIKEAIDFQNAVTDEENFPCIETPRAIKF